MPRTSGRSGLPARLAPWVLLLGLVALHAANNWTWLTKNVVIPGWDRPAHLARSLAYHATLTPLSWHGLFKASVQDPIRPPFFFASTTLLYWMFGISTDVATMVNIVYWLILLISIYRLGTHLGGRRLGTWGVVLTALVPMLYAMSRSFYIEFAMTAIVALTLYLLVASRGFQRRKLALGVGLALGLGMLTKRTYLLFVAGPVAVAILRSDVPRSLWERLRGGLRISFPDLLVAVGSGIALAALWYFPNRTQVEDLTLGLWLFPAWAGLVAMTVYLLLRRPKDPGVNCLSALSLGATLASVWYLPRVEVIRRLLLYGYGVADPRGRELDLMSIRTYSYYPVMMINEGLGLVFSVLLAAVGVGMVVWLLRKRSSGRTMWRADTGWWVLALWPIVPYLVLTFSIYKEARAFTPVLPGLALILAASLLQMPWRRLGRALLGLALVWGLLQFVVISYSEANGPAQQTQFRAPLLGATGLFARGRHIELPDAGITDPGYNIQPDVLARVDARRQAMGHESVQLGVLAQTAQINAGSFLYATLTRYPAIEVAELARNYEGGDPLSRLYGYEYLLVKRHNKDQDELAQAAIERILDDPPPLFKDAFVLETAYPLPDGDTAYLYRLRYWPDPSLSAAYVAEVSDYLTGAVHPGDALILSPPELLTPLSRQGTVEGEICLMADQATVRDRLMRVIGQQRRLFVLFSQTGAGDAGEFVEEWLSRNTYRADDRWFGNLRLVLYGTTMLPPAEQATQMWGARFGRRIELTGTDLPGQNLTPGDVIPLTLFWQARQPVGEDFKVFVHLLNPEGQLVAQHDSEPVGGFRPTSTWQVGESIVDRHGVLLPDDLPAGEYRLLVGLYEPVSGERLLLTASAGAPPDDHLAIGTVQVGCAAR